MQISRLRFRTEHPEHTKKKLKVMLNITYGMIYIFGDSIMTKSFTGAFRILKSSRSSISVRQPLRIESDSPENPRLWVLLAHHIPRCSQTCLSLRTVSASRMNSSRRHEMPQQSILLYDVFYVFGVVRALMSD
ncbi:hypothetical protein CR513_32754, partial [Mucuna pruriens]